MSQSGGEKELIIGNKQLISLFFVVVALCGVFFAMGYMVRGNSLKGSVSTTTTDSNSAALSDSVKRQQPEPPAETTDASTPSTQPGDTPPAPVETRPAQDTAAQTLTADVKSAPPVPAKVEAPPPPLGAPLEPGGEPGVFTGVLPDAGTFGPAPARGGEAPPDPGRVPAQPGDG